MKVKSSDLKVGDVLRLGPMFGTCLIAKLEKYTGPIDFVEKIAVFSNGRRLSIEKDHWYEVVDIDGEGYKFGEKVYRM